MRAHRLDHAVTWLSWRTLLALFLSEKASERGLVVRVVVKRGWDDGGGLLRATGMADAQQRRAFWVPWVVKKRQRGPARNGGRLALFKERGPRQSTRVGEEWRQETTLSIRSRGEMRDAFLPPNPLYGLWINRVPMPSHCFQFSNQYNSSKSSLTRIDPVCHVEETVAEELPSKHFR